MTRESTDVLTRKVRSRRASNRKSTYPCRKANISSYGYGGVGARKRSASKWPTLFVHLTSRRFHPMTIESRSGLPSRKRRLSGYECTFQPTIALSRGRFVTESTTIPLMVPVWSMRGADVSQPKSESITAARAIPRMERFTCSSRMHLI
jgi:hypothetical protein